MRYPAGSIASIQPMLGPSPAPNGDANQSRNVTLIRAGRQLRNGLIVLILSVTSGLSAVASCDVGGLLPGGPAPDLKAYGAYEIGKPADVKIPDAKVRRSLVLQGANPRYRQYVAIRDGALVAVVREFPDPTG